MTPYLTKIKDLAEIGDLDAQRCLGLLYFIGQDVAKDHIESYKWLSLAASKGERAAIIILAHLTETMTLEEISEAKRRAECLF